MTDFAQTAPNLQTWKLTLAYDGTDFRAGRCNPENPPSRASCRRRWAASRANLLCPRAPDAPTPASMPWARWQVLPYWPPFRRKTCFAPSTGPCLLHPHSGSENGAQPHSMRGTRPWPRPTSTGSSARRSARPFWPAMSMRAPGRWTWTRSERLPGSLRASTIF